MQNKVGFVIVLICTLYASPGTPQGWIMFGDTYSDAGLRHPGGGIGLADYIQETLQTNEVFPQAPYSNGAFTNGPTWTEYVAIILGIPLASYAAGGGTTGAGYAQNVKNAPLPKGFAGYPGDNPGSEFSYVAVPAPNLSQLLDRYLQSSNNTASPSDIFTIFMGTNDYFSIALDKKNLTAADVIDNIADAVDTLYKSGARRFILVTIPPLEAVAPTLLSDASLVATRNEHNELLLDLAEGINSTYPGSSVQVFRYDVVVSQILKSAGPNATNGILYPSLPCYPVQPSGQGLQSGVPVCKDPNQHYLWDTAHPTTAAHRLIAIEFAKQFGYLWGKVPAFAPSPSA